jgi:general secretion pathway protein G
MQRRRFSLVELMVVIAIIGMLSTVVVISIVGRDYDARVAKAQSDFKTFDAAIGLFKVDTGRFPRALEELWQRPGDVRRWGPDPYIARFPPKDPWGNAYVFERRGRRYELICYGADGAPGGTEEGKDLSASELLGQS